ncbi:Xaa-Pro aminopeptidase [Saliniradius amylolyticus]|uniref:Xaa-Pro aminopeptidase n=1 Tax=Saliniradius amylolyticus TaxID=2183582 RepID=A0A2S2E0G0_9ALTE|nr:Xaa-Pro aminopeptidase [Saliniradius amylolyticus]AWL11128.1 Xaa-Pro aminopeptidase [Saliniradius amylolyticus]
MIPIQEYVARRQRLAEQLTDNSLCVIPAAGEVTRSRDTEYPFRQDSDFYYLTGFNEPDAVLVLIKQPDELETRLYCRPKDPQAEVWHGRRLGHEAAKEQLRVDKANALDDFQGELESLLNHKTSLYFPQGAYEWLDKQVFATLQMLRNKPKTGHAPDTLIDPRPLIHQMRLIKSEAEIATMRQAAAISVSAHKRTMQYCCPGRYEYQLAAELHHEFAMHGAHYPAYGTIVGGGDNACILHYTANEDELAEGELVLIDAGGEFNGYAADITRTFPVSGRFSEPQKQLYQIVLDAQLAAFKHIKPGGTLVAATEAAAEVITQGLLDVGILEGSLQQHMDEKTYREYFIHGLGHWLGLDVHDVGLYKTGETPVPLQPGMVLTVEPGIYISPEADVAEQWRGIGIRIEDNLVVTEQGHDNLTQGVPKTIEAIEALMTTRHNLDSGDDNRYRL